MSMKDGQAVSQISDGQPQATQIADGQVQAPPAVSQISDGQPQAPPAVTQISGDQPQENKTKRQAACVSGYLTLTLENGTLKDQDGRLGYMVRRISLFVKMEQLLSVVQRIGGNVIRALDFIIFIVLRFHLMLVSVVNS